jgi:hypothetical protein
MKSKLTGGSLEAGQVYAVKYIEATNEQIFNKIQNEFVINKLIDRHPNIVMVEKVAISEYEGVCLARVHPQEVCSGASDGTSQSITLERNRGSQTRWSSLH